MISVLIPLYNVEKYIGRCLDSILSQTYQDFEIIVVNDCTLDNSAKIVNDFILRDKRIKMIHNEENMGLAWTRKVGYSNALGQYIVFCDSDDYLPSNALEILYDSIKSSDADIVVGNYQSVNSNDEFGHISNNKLFYGNDQQSVYKALLKNEMSHSLWGKIYKSELFKNKNYITNKGVINAEDAILFYQVIKNVNKVIVLDEVVYYYFQNLESSTNVRLSNNALSNIISFWNLRYNLLNEESSLTDLLKERFIINYCNIIKRNGNKEFIDNNITIPNFQNYITIKNIFKYYNILQVLKFVYKFKFVNKFS